MSHIGEVRLSVNPNVMLANSCLNSEFQLLVVININCFTTLVANRRKMLLASAAVKLANGR